MTELENLKALEKCSRWEKAKATRKTLINVIALFLAVIFAYISGNLLCKVSLTQTKKIFSYSWGTSDDDLKTNQNKLPKDYTEWYKKVKENVWVKNFGKKWNKEAYFTKGEIARREYEENKKEAGGGFIGDLAAWWLSKNLSEEEAKKVDHYQYARAVYAFTVIFLIISWILFDIVYHLLLRFLILPLIWREPILSEQKNY